MMRRKHLPRSGGVEKTHQLNELFAGRCDASQIGLAGMVDTDAVGSDAFNQNLSERRAATVRSYLVNTFKLPGANLHTAGYGKQRPKNKADVFAPENRRVEIVNETLQSQARR
jgi:flagellar motor protein MotB